MKKFYVLKLTDPSGAILVRRRSRNLQTLEELFKQYRRTGVSRDQLKVTDEEYGVEHYMDEPEEFAPDYLSDVPEYAHVMTVQDYLDSVACSGFIDYDGFGHPVAGGKEDDALDLRPSKNGSDIPKWATHVAWYNR